MRLNRRFVVALSVSLFWAGLVGAVFYRIAGGASQRARGAQPERPLVIAARPLPLGAILDRSSLKLRHVTEDMAPKGGFSKIEDVIDRPVISPIEPDEAVTETRIAARGSGFGLAPLIPPGMRAISVRVNDVVGVAGFVLPGMRVDVLVTGRPPNVSDTITRTVLQNIPVLSAGQTIQTDAKSQAITTPVVTLLVTPNDAEALTLANNEGHIQLVLRNSTDQQFSDTHGRHLHELYAAGAVEPAPAVETRPKTAIAKRTPAAPPIRPPAPAAPPTQHAAAAAPPLPRPFEITVIRGNVKTQEPSPEAKGERQ